MNDTVHFTSILVLYVNIESQPCSLTELYIYYIYTHKIIFVQFLMLFKKIKILIVYCIITITVEDLGTMYITALRTS